VSTCNAASIETRRSVQCQLSLRHMLLPRPWQVPHWKPALTISAVEDFTTYQEGAVPPQIQSSLQLLPESSTYLPVLFINEFWLLSEHLVAVNETINELPLELTFSITTMMRWLLTAQMQARGSPPTVPNGARCTPPLPSLRIARTIPSRHPDPVRTQASMEAQAGLHGKDTSDELKRMYRHHSLARLCARPTLTPVTHSVQAHGDFPCAPWSDHVRVGPAYAVRFSCVQE
jgi:hypothetical protein